MVPKGSKIEANASQQAAFGKEREYSARNALPVK